MAARRVSPTLSEHPALPPAPTPEMREAQLQSLAYDLAERQLREGTASAQVITQFLKSASSRERLEQEKMEQEKKLLEARSEGLESTKRMEAMYSEAMSAFRSYSGQEPTEINDEEY